MSRGVLLFAQNNAEIDYVKLATFSARQIKKFLDVPVSIVTDSPDAVTHPEVFDKIILIADQQEQNARFFYDGSDKHSKLVWKNAARANCYDLTPYDETLVIDVDYIVNSNFLNYCWNQPHDFLIYKEAYDLAQWRDNTEFNFVSDYSIPFYWATVFFFRKNKNTQSFFDIVSHVKSNWQYYKFVYQIHSSTFRNDFAFSIALHMMNGYTENNFAHILPRKLFFITDTDYLLSVEHNKMQFLLRKNHTTTDYYPSAISNTDVHVMNKYSLLRVIDDN
jgi:hypothetical protein